MGDSKKAGENDIRKVFNLVKEAISKLDKSKFSASGGVILSKAGNMLTLKRDDETGGAAIDFDNKMNGIIRVLGSIVGDARQFSVLDKANGKTIFAVSEKIRQIYDYRTGTLKEILVKGDQVTAEQVTVKNGAKSLTIKPGADQIDFVSAGGKWRVQSHYSDVLERQAFALYDMDADYDGKGRAQEMLHLSQKTRTIFNSKRNKTAGIVVDDDLRFWPGDTWNMGSDIPFAGYLTTGGTQIYFTIPLHKKCQDTTAALNGKLTVRGTEGYILNLADASDFKITTSGYENLLRVIVEKPDKSAFSELNNISVAVSFNHNPSITFS